MGIRGALFEKEMLILFFEKIGGIRVAASSNMLMLIVRTLCYRKFSSLNSHDICEPGFTHRKVRLPYVISRRE